jgi:hypothetical protein
MQDGDMPLHLASLIGQLDVVQYLIEECGADDVNAKNVVSKFPSFLPLFLFFLFFFVSHCNTIFTPISVLTSEVCVIVVDWSHSCPLCIIQWAFGRGAIFD